MGAPHALTPAAIPSRRQLIAPLGFMVLLGAMMVFLAVTHLTEVRQTRQWVRHSHEIIETTQALFIDVLDVESGARGYLASGDPRYLDHFDSAKAAAPAQMAALHRMLAHRPDQQARADKLIALANQRIAIATMRVNLLKQGRLADARGVSAGAGKSAMDQARAEMAAMMSAERALLAERTARANHAELTSFIIALTVGGLAAIGLGFSFVTIFVNNRRLAHEVAERRAAEAAQHESEAGYRAIFANSADYLSVIDVLPDGRFQMAEVNPAYERATQLGTQQVKGVDIADLAPEPQASRLIAHMRRVVEGGKPAFTRDRLTLNNAERVWETVLVPVRNSQGAVDRIIGSTRDVTEREEAQLKSRRAQRMEAVGHLTGGVAHDFNNLLQVIRGNLELVLSGVEDDEPVAARVRNALHGAHRAAQLTRQLLAFARRQPLAPKVISLGRLVTDMAEMLRRTLGERIEVETVIAGGLWNTLADPAQVESAILNLAINARDAMPTGGRLTVEITNAVLDEAYVKGDPELETGDYVLLSVSDTGHGMDADTIAKVFEPFFTTKGEEKGTGLGLSMVYGFVKQSRGNIQIYSAIGQGTTVKIYLPRSNETASAAEPAPAGSLRGRSEVILVVEDDDMVRASAVGMLRDLGYACMHASDGASALQILKAGTKIDLLFTDVIMPGAVKARELAAEAERLRPGLPVLFTSGFTDDAIVHQGRLDPGVQLISKPYARDDLARRILALLKDRRPVVLVVEDEPLVRLAAVDMIDALGFRPIEAADAQAALAQLRSGQRVDILFTDVGLPGMRGPELAQEATKLRPNLRVIFASGYDEADEDTAGAAHLGKPYEQDQLAHVLGSALS
jgi:PAS domain S-box-containing protein